MKPYFRIQFNIISVFLLDITFLITGQVNKSDSKTRNKPYRMSDEERLLKNLLRNYDVDARGVASPNQTVTVTIQLLLLRIQALEEISQTLTTTGLIITDWEDYRLRWNPMDYHNLTDIVISPSRIWQPEIALMNGAQELAPDFQKIRALVNHNGVVHWEPGGIFRTTCDIDIRYFPFDEQSCPIQMGAWAYYSARMNLTNSSSEVQTHDFKLNGEWNIIRTQAEWRENILPCCLDIRYPYVEFTLFLRRRNTFYVMNIILPCTLLSVLVMIVFCLPPDAGEKISLGISVLLAFTVFLLMVAENVPRTSLHIPLMVLYLTCTMALGTMSVCMTVLVLNIHHRDPERDVPRWAKVVFMKYLSKILHVQPRKPKSLAEHVIVDDGETHIIGIKEGIRKLANDQKLMNPMLPNNCDHNGHKIYPFVSGKDPEVWNDWKELANVIDRLFFWITFLLMSCSSVVILTIHMFLKPADP